MKPEVKVPFSIGNLPFELEQLDRWVLWKYVQVKDKWAKVPYQNNGSKASSTDPSTWNNFAACALHVAEGYDGLGFVFNGDGIVGIDLDKVIDDSGMWSDKAQDVLDAVPGYAEISPSGTGLHIITRANLSIGKAKDGVEVYSTGRYFTITANVIRSHPLVPQECQDLTPFVAKYFGTEALSRAPQEVSDLDEALPKAPVGKDLTQMRAALKYLVPPPSEPECTPYIWAIHHETGGSEEGLQLAHEWCSNAPEYDHDYVEERWGRARDDKGNAKTWRSVEFEAKKNGWGKVVSSSKFVHAAQFMSDQKVEWHVKHVIPKRGLIVVYGAPGSSKSFFVLDMVASIARGVEWRGHRVKQCPVAYVAAEGVSGFGNRLKAYSLHHEVPMADIPMYVRGGSLILASETLGLIEELKVLPEPGVVVIDTLAAVSPGANENTSEGMGPIVQSAQMIIEATGATVILIHHTNKAGEMRGWSGLLGALDNQIRVEKNEDLKTAHIEKLKEEKDGSAYGYRLKIVNLGIDEDGDSITSCAIEPCEDITPIDKDKKGKKPRGGGFETSATFAKARKYLEVIQEEAGLGNANIDEDDIVKAIQKAYGEGFEDNPRVDNIKRTLLTLASVGKITKEGRWIRVR